MNKDIQEFMEKSNLLQRSQSQPVETKKPKKDYDLT